MFRGTILGRFHDFLTIRIPKFMEYIWTKLMIGLEYILGKTIYSKLEGCCGFIMNDKHPIVQIFYLILVSGGLWIFSLGVAPRIPNEYISDSHWYLITPVVVLTYGCFFVASFSDPGKLNSANVARVQELWPYDHVLYDKKTCRTCLFQRPARSKHCSVCKMCIAKLDHHW